MVKPRRAPHTARVRTRRPSPALVISLIALFVSMTGVGWAALGKNTIGSKQIKPGGVKSSDVADDSGDAALTGEDLSNAGGGTLGSADVANDAVGAPELAPGSVTPSELAPNSVSSASVIPNALTGADVNESTLDPAPRKFRRAMPDTTLATRILDLGGLRIDAGCSAAEDLTLIASSGFDNSVFQFNAVNDANDQFTVAEADLEETDARNLHTALVVGNSMAQGTFVYTRANGTVVTGSLVMGQGFPFDDGAADCVVAGQAWRSE